MNAILSFVVTLLTYVFACQMLAGAPEIRVNVTAPTGVAALNVSGMTIHRFCGMLLGPKEGQDNESYFAELEADKRPSVWAGFRRVRNCDR